MTLRCSRLKLYDLFLALQISHYQVVTCSDSFPLCSFHVEGVMCDGL